MPSRRVFGLPACRGRGILLAMKSHELLREVFDSCSPKQVATDLGLSLSMVYKWAEPAGESGAANPLDRIEGLLKSTQDQRIVQWVCERAGGFFIPNPNVARQRSFAVLPATNRIVQEFADMLAVIASAALDNSISPTEAEKIRSRWEDLKSVTEGFVRCCEQGEFGPLRVEGARS
jgi:hypothetical protein